MSAAAAEPLLEVRGLEKAFPIRQGLLGRARFREQIQHRALHPPIRAQVCRAGAISQRCAKVWKERRFAERLRPTEAIFLTPRNHWA